MTDSVAIALPTVAPAGAAGAAGAQGEPMAQAHTAVSIPQSAPAAAAAPQAHAAVSMPLATAAHTASPFYRPTASDGPYPSPTRFSSYALPRQSAVASESRVPLGVLVSPLCTLEPAPPRLLRPPLRCKGCRTVISRFAKIHPDRRQWSCNLCGVLNDLDPAAGELSPESYPELHLKVVEYVDPTNQPYTFAQMMGGGADKQNPLYVFCVDTTSKADDFNLMRSSLRSAVAELPDGAVVGLVAFSSVITVYRLGARGVASGMVLPGIASLTNEDLGPILSQPGLYMAPLSDSRETLNTILDSLHSSCGPSALSSAQRRCVGVATEAALALITGRAPASDAGDSSSTATDGDGGGSSATSTRSGKVLIVTSGTPNFGPGSLPDRDDEPDFDYYLERCTSHYTAMSTVANESNVVIDVFCAGISAFRVSAYHTLTVGTGGAVLIHKDFGDSFEANVRLALFRSIGMDASFSVTASIPVSITHIVGPAAPAGTFAGDEDSDNEIAARRKHCRMGDAQPAQCFALFYQLDEDVDAGKLCFQFATTYLDYDHQRVLRVVTQELKVAEGMSEFLQSVDIDVASVLLARQAVLLARKTDDETEVPAFVDDQLYELCVQCGTKGADRVFRLPGALEAVPRRMFHLRRGPMVGLILQHPDDIEFVRSLFLTRNVEDSIMMIEPQLFGAKVNEQLQAPELVPLPLENLVLQSTWVLLLDHFTDIFIWSGRHTDGAEFDRLREYCHKIALERSQRRFPQPQIMAFREGSSMARWMECRLTPSNKDPPALQEQAFPLLAAMDPTLRAQLLKKFHHTDDMSFFQWYNGLF